MSDLLNSASLVMIPSGYKEDVVYSQIPTDGSGDLSFTRASNGTRINSSGLVEVCPWNLVKYSEDFSNAIWNKINSNGVTPVVTANDTIAPNGTLTADKIVFSNGGGGILNGVFQYFTTFEGARTASVWLKSASGTPTVYITTQDDTTGGNYTTCVLSTEWQRFEVTYTTAALNAQSILIGYYTASGTPSGPSGSLTVYAWGAQVNIGSTAKPYFPTTDRLNVPRLTYQNGGGGCPSLLLEKQSTNLAIYSEDFTNAAYIQSVPSGTLTITANYSTSPDGTQNADRLQYSGGSQYTQLYQLLTHSTNVVSIYVKSNTSSSQTFRLWGNDFAQVSSNLTATTSWQRFDFAVTGSGTKGVGFCTDSSGNALDISIWGFQFEASSYPTSYIPTTSSSATRVADACYKTGISSLIGQTEGTIFYDLPPTIFNNSLGTFVLLELDGNISAGYAHLYKPTGANEVIFQVANAGILQCSLVFALNNNTRYKVAAVYKNNRFELYVNGVLRASDYSGTLPSITINKIQVAGDGFNANSQLSTNEVVLFKTALTQSECEQLTA